MEKQRGPYFVRTNYPELGELIRRSLERGDGERKKGGSEAKPGDAKDPFSCAARIG